MKQVNTKPILITGAPRSGATFIARILSICGAQKGMTDKMYENISLRAINSANLSDLEFPTIVKEEVGVNDFAIFNKQVNIALSREFSASAPFYFKDAQLTLNWRFWHKKFPNAQWVVVRRKTPYIINSCEKTQYMNLMKKTSNLEKIGATNERQGWLWNIHQYENEWQKMLEAGLDFQEVYPDRMANHDFSKIIELLENLGLGWDNEIVNEIAVKMNPYFTGKERSK